MQAEIEIRFFGVDYEELRQKLLEAGARQAYPMRAMRRVIIDYPDQHLQHGVDGAWSFVRLRDEGGRALLTYKQIAKSENHDTHEIETEVSSYENTIALFEKIGLAVISEQHTKREVWRMGGCEISLDEWPWLPPMVEIEGPNDEALQAVVESLGLNGQETINGNVVNAYRKVYPGMTEEDSIRDIPLLTFEEMPQWLKERQ
jgi:adenylate cyclase class 2